MQCFTCRQIFRTHQELFSHIHCYHNDEFDYVFSISRRQHLLSCLLHNLSLNSTLPQILFFQNYSRIHNQTRSFQPVTMANNNNNNPIGRFVQSQVRSQPLQPQFHLQPQVFQSHPMQPQPQSQVFPPQPMQPQPQPQVFQPQPMQPQLEIQLQPHVMESETLVNYNCTLPLIEQLEREWPKTIILEDDEKDFIELELKL